MEIQDARTGTRVIIKGDLFKTHHLWTASSEMHEMARTGKYFIVDRVVEMTPSSSPRKEFAVEVSGYYFAPEDLELYEPEGPKEVIMETIKEVKFDPASL
jgi:hypothetical protein